VIHDRASFHFLTKKDIQKYATLLSDILETNGLYFVEPFSESGLKMRMVGNYAIQQKKFLKIFGNDFRF
jgi:hypothetical protein